MKPSAILSSGVAVVAAGFAMNAFLANASPYGNFQTARKTQGTEIHVAGDVQKETIVQDRNGKLTFRLKDENGESMQVIYTGSPISNFTEATRVVAIGTVKGQDFASTRMLVKCPSKYENAPAQPKS